MLIRSILKGDLDSVNRAEHSSIFGVDEAVELVEVRVLLGFLDLVKSLLLSLVLSVLLGQESHLPLFILFGISVSNINTVNLNEAVNSRLNLCAVKLIELSTLVDEAIELVIVFHPVVLLLFFGTFDGIGGSLLLESCNLVIIKIVESILNDTVIDIGKLDSLGSH